jgi:hypothetical protein
MQKVFGVGFSKTGTTSLEEALQILGYSVCRGHWQTPHTFYLLALYIHRDYEEIFRMVNYWDAFADGPWGGTDLYVQLYKRLPESKFILTIRDAESWYFSFEKLITKFDLNLETALDSYHARRYGSAYFFKHIFGIDTMAGSRQKIISHYNAYNKKVKDYLSRNRADFIEFDIPAGDGWEKLCEFLGKEIPNQPFPHENKSIDNLNLSPQEILHK